MFRGNKLNVFSATIAVVIKQTFASAEHESHVTLWLLRLCSIYIVSDTARVCSGTWHDCCTLDERDTCIVLCSRSDNRSVPWVLDHVRRWWWRKRLHLGLPRRVALWF